MAIYQLGDLVPVIPASCYIAPEATIIGSVTLGERVTVETGRRIGCGAGCVQKDRGD